MVWYSHLFKNFPQFVVIHTIKGFGVVNKTEVDVFLELLLIVIQELNHFRREYLVNRDKDDWWQMIQLLPSSYNQTRTVMLNYEVLRRIYHSRRNHKLDEWHTFCEWIESLPHSDLITGEESGE